MDKHWEEKKYVNKNKLKKTTQTHMATANFRT